MRVMIFLALMFATAVPAFARFIALGTIDVTIRDSVTAEPIAGATVVVTAPHYRREIVTDQTGRFILGYLQPGSYTIEARKEGYSRVYQSVDVAAGRISTVALSAPPALRWIARVMHVDWPAIVAPNITADVYIPVWGRSLVNPFTRLFSSCRSFRGLRSAARRG